MNDFAKLYCNMEEVEVRKDDNGQRTAKGYAALFDKLSPKRFNFQEKIRSGAFKNSIKKGEIKALWNHDDNFVLGSMQNGTLRLEEDERGLKFELDLPDTQAGKDAAVSIKRKDVTGMSFGFRAIKQEWDEKDPKNIIRTLVEVECREISPTAFPYYPTTKVNIRSENAYEEYRKTKLNESERINNENDLKTKLREIDAL